MIILASAEIRQNYNRVVEKCKESQGPVFLTKNGEGELVVFDIDTYNRREQEIKLMEAVLQSRLRALMGEKAYSIEELEKELDLIVPGDKKNG